MNTVMEMNVLMEDVLAIEVLIRFDSGSIDEDGRFKVGFVEEDSDGDGDFERVEDFDGNRDLNGGRGFDGDG